MKYQYNVDSSQVNFMMKKGFLLLSKIYFPFTDRENRYVGKTD